MTTVEEFAPFAAMLGAERAGRREADDIAQEALIAVWEADTARPDAGRSYLIGAAKNAANGAAAGRKLTGAASRQGRREPAEGAASLDHLRDEGLDLEGRPGADVSVRESVRAAVRGLPRASDRELCYLRYWRELTFADCATEMGADADALMRRWSGHVVPALRLLLGGAL